ncbi:MAG: HAMP domain-containing protein [Parasporobacterium sp.]|nr:HAMP domain-containing protein [Parasporobacterium sp.]
MIILVVGIIPIFILEFVLTNVAETTVVSTRMKNVGAQFSMLSTYFTRDNNITEKSEWETDMLVDDVAGIFMSRIQVINRDFKIISDTYQINKGKICISKYVNDCFYGQNTTFVDKANQCIIMAQPVRDIEGNVRFALVAMSSISDIYSAMDSIRLIGISLIVVLLVTVLFFAVFLSYVTIRPFRYINETIAKIDKGHMTEKIDMKGCTEIVTISGSFNMMLDRINQLEDSRQMFVSNVSHELKTPMTSMKVLCDSLLQQGDVPAEMYREFMSDLSNEINRENTIITDLLTLVKLDNANIPLNISQVNINKMVESILKLVRPLAKEKNIELVLESFRPIIAEVDEVKLSMAISNLVENGIKYNNPDGYVRVSLNADKTYCYIKVKDNGKGIPEESIPLIFDRFYRVDKARDRATGGSGLGLSITKSIVLAHNGDIRVYSEDGKGTVFNMQIPLTYYSKERKE